MTSKNYVKDGIVEAVSRARPSQSRSSMRSPILALVLASSSLVLACSADESPGVPSRGPRSDPAESAAAAPTAESGATTTPAAACAAVADAKPIAADADAADLRIADGAVFFRTGTKVVRAAKDGSGKATVYESPALVRSSVTPGGIVLAIEDTEGGAAVVKIASLEDDALVAAAIPTSWNAGGSYFIGADGESFYAVGDEAQGEVIYRFTRGLPVLTPLATVTDVISSAQLASGSLWYVRDGSRVFSIPIAAAGANDPIFVEQGDDAKEVFGSSGSCALAVGQDAAFCSAGAILERRDLSGANPKTILQANESKVAAPFGSATWFGGTLYVRASAPDAQMGWAIRAIAPNAAGVDEKIVACGRTGIGEIAVDQDAVVWTEPGKGVFTAPR